MGLCTAPYKMLLMKVSHSFELARQKKEEKHFAHFASSDLALSQCFLLPLGVFLVMKTLKDVCTLLLRFEKQIFYLGRKQDCPKPGNLWHDAMAVGKEKL